MATWLIGIDDTDNDSSPGTGQIARRLMGECLARAWRHAGVTRHQFLVDPRIPYTSHNSGACLAVEGEGDPGELEFAFEWLAGTAADGSDPGLCLMRARAVSAEMIEFGWRAKREVVTMDQARQVARRAGADLRELGGSGLGVIGALASAALRADGNEGRFLDLPGLRELGQRVHLDEIRRLGVHVLFEQPPPEGGGAWCETLNWVRPRLADGQAVWPVKWSMEHDAWVPVDSRKNRPLE
ncbi:MAG: hypothetical protein BWX88_02872 [Planctomycetes bacterium ADurb.Bin126]|nr:MAG: hypothetical protein BWX88_02872 [Planctomycetes bacterium ADurb.Bin126]HOD82700.1 hypothetical protein [Phycisphaerae bacterium]HQL72585.1 hypothetical protein [Phycisphaerae bacterium]